MPLIARYSVPLAAVPLLLPKFTVTMLELGALRLTTKSTYPSPSPAVTSATEITGVLTAVWLPWPISAVPTASGSVAPVTPDRTRLKLSSGFAPGMSGTVTVFAISPGANVRLPLTGTKSLTVSLPAAVV